MQHKATRSWSLPAIILAFVLAAALLAQVLTQAAVSNQAFAAETNPTADADTTTSYPGSLGENNSTRYAGRVWTDKTVYTENAVFTGTVDGESKRYEITNDSDFLVAYSALATSQAISGETKVPVDVVFVIDNSNSMDENLNDPQDWWDDPPTRLEATVEAVNASIKQIMESNANSRVAVVIYGLEAETLLPLGHYSPLRSGNYIDLDSQYIDGGWLGSSGYRTTFTAPGNRRVTMDPGDRGTNTHMGVDRGMDILATASNITSELPNGSTVKHVPALILLSDGASTAAGRGDWWNPSGRRGDGMADNASTSYTFAVAMNAAYQKQRVNEHYGVEADSDFAAKIYTIGMGIEQLYEGTGWGADNTDYYRAQMALDPGTHINDNNNVAETIKDAWDWYVNGKRVNTGTSWRPNWQTTYEPEIDGWTFEHPTSGDINGDPEALHYNDGYYAAENAEDVVNVFDDITGSILTGAPSVPTEVTGDDPVHDGYITYTDPIGQYLEVKDVKAILWSGTLFQQKETQPISNGTRYVFQGDPINSPVYGEHELSEIIIDVTTAADGQQTLTVQIPATCIPLRVNTITLDANDRVESNVSNDAYPFRLLYTVGLKNGVVDAEGRVTDMVSQDYITANTENGMVNFYSNLYSKQTQGQDDAAKTVGDATVTFTPASDNPFYFVQENTPLYLDEGRTPATRYDRNATYYFQISYYEGTELKTAWVSRSADLMDGYTERIDGQLNLKAGSPRLGYLTQFIKDKGHNTTNTAATSYYPTFEGTPEAGEFVVYLGNNGKLQVDAPVTPPGDLTISKTVGGNQGATDKDFTFDVRLTKDSAALTGTYSYTKTNADATQITGTVSVGADGKATFTPNGGTAGALTLKGGESVTISDLPAGTSFTVTEQDPNKNGAAYETSIVVNNGDEQTPEDRTASGTIVSEKTQTVAYTNTWNVLMHSFDFTKIDGTDTNKPLKDAQFKLFEPVCQDPSHNHENELIEAPFEPDPNCWKLVTDENHPDGVFTSGEDGVISFDDLLANGVTYRLVEVQAPDGFQRPQGQWDLTITQVVGEGGTEVRVNTTAVGAMNSQPAFIVDSGDYYLPNYRPMDPPITGGRGMTGFMLGGGLLIALGLSAAAFWLIRSSKQKRNGYRYR